MKMTADRMVSCINRKGREDSVWTRRFRGRENPLEALRFPRDTLMFFMILGFSRQLPRTRDFLTATAGPSSQTRNYDSLLPGWESWGGVYVRLWQLADVPVKLDRQ